MKLKKETKLSSAIIFKKKGGEKASHCQCDSDVGVAAAEIKGEKVQPRIEPMTADHPQRVLLLY